MHYNTCITELPLNKAEHACININTVIQCECAVIIIFFKLLRLNLTTVILVNGLLLFCILVACSRLNLYWQSYTP